MFGHDHPNVAAILSNIGLVFLELDRLEEAHELFCTSVDVNQDWYGSESVKVASSLVNLGSMFVIQGDYALAREMYEKALQLYQTEDEKFPGEVDRLERIAN